MENEFKGAYAQMRREIIESYLFLRKNNMTIPSETLEFMKDAAISKLDSALIEKDERDNENCDISNIKDCFLFSNVEPPMNAYISLIWDSGSECDCLYVGLNKDITPLPTRWRYV